MNFFFLKRFFLIITMCFSNLSLAEDYLSGYEVAPSSSKTVYSVNGTWYKIDNASVTKRYFIPTKTTTEYNAFLANTPPDLTITATAAPSCLAAYNYQGLTTDGNLTIDPDGPGGSASFSVYCDMTTDGGGWTRLTTNLVASSTIAFNGSDVISGNNVPQGCGDTADNFSITGIKLQGYTEMKYILTRTTSIIQCARIIGATGSASLFYKNGASWVAEGGGDCGWDVPWGDSPGVYNPAATVNTPLIWKKIRGLTNTNFSFRSVCSSGADNGVYSMEMYLR